MTASFVSPLPPLEGRRPPALDLTPTDADGDSKPSAELLVPDVTPMPRPHDGQAHLPPITPSPYPAMSDGEEQYASVDGVVVWESAVEDSERLVFKRDGAWEVIWRGHIPLGQSIQWFENME